MPSKPTQTAAKKRPGKVFSPEIIYPFWKNAGGIVQDAIRLAQAANEKRVPLNAHTWGDYAKNHGFAERMSREEKAKWDRFHQEREDNEQRVLDGIAHGFEQVAGALMQEINRNITEMRAEDKQKALDARKWLLKMFGTMDAVDKFYRMFLRARGKPERISTVKNEHSGGIATYDQIEEKSAKNVDEATKAAEKASLGKEWEGGVKA